MNKRCYDANEEKIIEDLKNTDCMTKGEQHLIILLRVLGRTDGKSLRELKVYTSIRIFKAIKNLENAGWLEREYKHEEGRTKVFYRLTKKGEIFNSYLMEHPEFSTLYDKIPKKLILPFGK